MNRDAISGQPGNPPEASGSQHLGRQHGGDSNAQPSPLLGQESGMPIRTATKDGGPADRRSAAAGQPASRKAAAPRPQRPPLGGGLPPPQRELGAHGRATVRRRLEARLPELAE